MTLSVTVKVPVRKALRTWIVLCAPEFFPSITDNYFPTMPIRRIEARSRSAGMTSQWLAAKMFRYSALAVASFLPGAADIVVLDGDR